MSMRFKLMLSLLLGYVLVASILHLEWIPRYMDHTENSFVANQRDILGTLAPGLVPALLERDYANLYVVLDHTFAINADQWVSLALTEPGGRRLYPLQEAAVPTGGALISIGHELMDYDERVGTLSLVADWSGEAAVQRALVNSMELTVLAVFALVALVSMLWQTSWIFDPLNDLQHAARRLSMGDFDAQLPLARRDEIGALTRAFEEMRANVQSAQSSLEEALRESEASAARIQAILDSASEAIISVDASGIIETFNHSAEATFGHSFTDIAGTAIDALVDIGRPTAELIGMDAETEKAWRDTKGDQLAGRRSDGSRFPLEFSIAHIKGSDPARYIFTMRDITERRRSEMMKDEFISAVSHELRTPLTAINGAVSLIKGNPKEELSTQTQELLTLADRNVGRLLMLINDLLDISKLESGGMGLNLQPTAIDSFLEQSVAMNQAYADQFDVTFVLGRLHSATVITDSDRLGQVVSNLLSNAAKFSPRGGEVQISARVEDDQVRIDVADHGPGIPAEFQDKIFEKFTQHDSGNTRSVGSTGLGLNISRSLVTRLGGTLRFDTSEGEGTTFHVDLPLKP